MPVVADVGAAANVKTSPAVSAYRRLALAHYERDVGGRMLLVCVVCGFGIPEVLEVAHLNQDRKDGDIDNLALLCPTHHKMQDIGLFPEGMVKQLRDANLQPNWGLRVKDAGKKAAQTRLAKAQSARRSAAGKKAWSTRVSIAAKPPST